METGETTLTVTLTDREDGGIRVFSDDLPGLILSGPNKETVINQISVAVVAMLEHRGFRGVSVRPVRAIHDILNGKNPQAVDMHVQHFVVEYREAA